MKEKTLRRWLSIGIALLTLLLVSQAASAAYCVDLGVISHCL